MVYNLWIAIGAAFGAPLPSGYNGMCVKAITEAGNIKSGSTCWNASTTSGAINTYADPYSLAYYYFGGSGTSSNNNGLAYTS